jgi:hypothetical protein
MPAAGREAVRSDLVHGEETMARSHLPLAAIAALSLLAACSGESRAPTGAAPVITSVAPAVVAQDAAFELVVLGANFGGAVAADAQAAPTLAVRRTRLVGGASASDAPLSWRVAVAEESGGVERVRAAVPGTLPPGVYAVSLENAKGGSRTYDDAFVVLPPPGTSGVEALPAAPGLSGPLACAANALTLAVHGTNLFVAGAAAPTVEIVPSASAPSGTRRTLVSQPASCTAIPFSRASIALCTRLDAPLPTDTAPGAWAVQVTVPPFATATAPLPLVVDGLPPLVTPAGVSVETADHAFDVVSGSGGVIVGPSGLPSVTLGGTALETTAAECSPLDGATGYERCAKLHVVIPQGSGSGTKTVRVSTASGCAREASLLLVPRPVVSGVQPAPFCRGSSGGVTITGSGFLDPTVYYLEGETQKSLSLESSCPSASALCGEIVLRPPTLAPATWQAVVQNASTPPVASAPFALEIGAGPPLVDVPSVRLLATGVARELHVDVYERTGSIAGVTLLPTESPAAAGIPILDFAEDSEGVTFTFPADAPADHYLVQIRDGSPCPGVGVLMDGIRATDDAVIAEHDFEVLEEFEVGTWWELESGGVAAPDVERVLSEGKPGFSAVASADGTAPWYFTLFGWGAGTDVGALRFALRWAGTGAPVAVPGVVLVNESVRLERTLPSPTADVWTAYDVALDDPAGWTYRDLTGSRPATLADFRLPWTYVYVLGAWSDGPGETALDDVVIELAR